MNRDDAIKVMAATIDAIESTVRDCGWAPAGVLYAACQHQGMKLDTFEAIMGAMVQANRLRREGDIYLPGGA